MTRAIAGAAVVPVTGRPARSGVTLLELLVVMLLLALTAGIAVASFAPRWTYEPDARGERARRMMAEFARAREEALRTGRTVVVRLDQPTMDTATVQDDTSGLDGVVTRAATALPDGSVVADSQLAASLLLDRLAGRGVAAEAQKDRAHVRSQSGIDTSLGRHAEIH